MHPAHRRGATVPFSTVYTMVKLDFSSGDLRADKRADYATMLAGEGDYTGAATLMADALELAPTWAAGWAKLGDYHAQAQHTDAAIAAYQTALRLDPLDHMGAGLQLDLLRRVPMADTMPRAFVESLFDQYAPRFDQALVEKLGYRVPELLRDALLRAGHSHFPHVLDLGCGTGLMGQAIRPHTGQLSGVDLSAGMLRQARAKGIYDQLEKADITALPLCMQRYNLILAADVFIYLGALEQVVGWAAAHLDHTGLLAFTVEAAGPGAPDFVLQPSRRYAHSREYVVRLLAQAGLAITTLEPTVLRHDRGQALAGYLVIARGRTTTTATEGDGQMLAPA